MKCEVAGMIRAMDQSLQRWDLTWLDFLEGRGTWHER